MKLFVNILRISQTGIASLIGIFMSIIRVKLIALIAGSKGVGILGQLSNLNNIAAFTTVMGTQPGVVNELAQAKGENDLNRIAAIKNLFLLLTFFGTLASSVVIYVFSEEINTWLFPDQDYILYVRLVALNSLFLGLTLIPSTLLQAYSRIKKLMVYSIISGIINTLIVVLLLFKYNIDGVVYAFAINSFFNFLLGIVILRQVKISLFHRKSFVWAKTGSLTKQLLKYGTAGLLTSISFQIGYAVIKSNLIAQDGLDSAGLYQSVANLSNQYLPVFLTSLSTFLLPHLAESNKTSFSSDANYSLRAIILLAIPVMLGLVVFRAPLLKMLYSTEFLAAQSLLGWMILADFLKVINRVMGTIVIVNKNFFLWILMDILTITSAVAGCFYFFPLFNLEGIALAFVLSQLILMIVYLIALKIKYAFKISRRIQLISLIMIFVIVALNLIESFVLTLFIALIFLTVIYAVGLTRLEWVQVRKAINKTFGK